MYDMHYDLLTILYFNMMKNNKFANKEKLIKDLRKIYRQDNVLGGLINLYFMTPSEMKEELDISLEEMKDIKKMFSKSIQFLNRMKDAGVIPITTNFIYSIEGCDYIDSMKTLKELYHLGLRSILPVWNHQNQYGSGNRSESGLTEKGKELIEKAIELGIIIDVSHANQQTFDDILKVYQAKRKENSIIIASHSNVRTLCDRNRNLTDQQLRQLKEVNGYIGLFTNGNFLSKNNEKLSYHKRQIQFLKHLDYLINIIGYDIDKIVLATDDMNFNPDESYHHLEAFSIENIGIEIYQLIANQYGESIARKITRENTEHIIMQVNHQNQKIYHK